MKEFVVTLADMRDPRSRVVITVKATGCKAALSLAQSEKQGFLAYEARAAKENAVC